MTAQTKHYISLSDVTHFRFDCKKCGATLSLPISDTRELALKTCPSCKIVWTAREGRALDKVIQAFRESLQDVQKIAADDYPAPLDFTIMLELKPPAPQEPSSSRAARDGTS